MKLNRFRCNVLRDGLGVQAQNAQDSFRDVLITLQLYFLKLLFYFLHSLACHHCTTLKSAVAIVQSVSAITFFQLEKCFSSCA